jgi:quercetin dioxygenase-like cupin family protein
MKKHLRSLDRFRWEGIDSREYKEMDGSFRSVTRQVLLDADDDPGCQVRYFEIGPGGHTTLERHRHVHVVLILRGAGNAVVGDELLELKSHDLVHVPPLTWHQFLAAGSEPLGFLCLVRSDRDRPARPTPEELTVLKSDPVIGQVIR